MSEHQATGAPGTAAEAVRVVSRLEWMARHGLDVTVSWSAGADEEPWCVTVCDSGTMLSVSYGETMAGAVIVAYDRHEHQYA